MVVGNSVNYTGLRLALFILMTGSSFVSLSLLLVYQDWKNRSRLSMAFLILAIALFMHIVCGIMICSVAVYNSAVCKCLHLSIPLLIISTSCTLTAMILIALSSLKGEKICHPNGTDVYFEPPELLVLSAGYSLSSSLFEIALIIVIIITPTEKAQNELKALASADQQYDSSSNDSNSERRKATNIARILDSPSSDSSASNNTEEVDPAEIKRKKNEKKEERKTESDKKIEELRASSGVKTNPTHVTDKKMVTMESDGKQQKNRRERAVSLEATKGEAMFGSTNTIPQS